MLILGLFLYFSFPTSQNKKNQRIILPKYPKQNLHRPHTQDINITSVSFPKIFMKKKPFQVRESIYPLRLSSLKNRCFKMYLLFFKISNSKFTIFTHRDIQTHIHDLLWPEHTHKSMLPWKNLKPQISQTYPNFPYTKYRICLSVVSAQKNMKRCGFFWSGEEISRILGFNGQNRLLASIWLLVK